MSLAPVPQIAAKASSPPQNSSRIPVQTLDQDDFLRLLVAQLTAQDPLNPKKDTDFIAQMATFSSLEQARSMQADIARLRADQELLKANALIGRTVEILDGDVASAGIVRAIHFIAGNPQIIVNEQSYSLDKILAIHPSAPPLQPPTE